MKQDFDQIWENIGNEVKSTIYCAVHYMGSDSCNAAEDVNRYCIPIDPEITKDQIKVRLSEGVLEITWPKIKRSQDIPVEE